MRTAKLQLRETTTGDDSLEESLRHWWWELNVEEGELCWTVTDDTFYVSRAQALFTAADVVEKLKLDRMLKLDRITYDPFQVTAGVVQRVFAPRLHRPATTMSVDSLNSGLKGVRAIAGVSDEDVAKASGLSPREVRRCEQKVSISTLHFNTVQKYLSGCGYNFQIVPTD